MLENLFFVKAGGRAVKFTDDDRKFPARISEHCGSTYSLNAIQDERTPCACSIGELMFGEAVRVPRHNKSLQSWSEAVSQASDFETTLLVQNQE
jgi:hypothetical protein